MTEHFTALIPELNESVGKLEVVSPYDGKLIATVDTVNAAAVNQALTTAAAVFSDKHRWLSPAKRIEILDTAAEIMQTRFEELAVAAAHEGGKPLIDSRVEVARAIDGVKNCVECVRNNAGIEIPMQLNAASAQRLAFTHKEPIGVVVAVSAFNHPLNLIVHQVCPAIAAGCPVIVKPAEDTPLSCFRLVSILHEAGLPPEYCQALMTDSLDSAAQLVVDPRVSFFSFIGSAKVGWMLRSKLAPGARCALEHGGAAPVIVAADADIDSAAPPLAKGGFYHAGQVCVSVQRIFAHISVARPLAEKIAALGNAMQVGDPTAADTDVGPLIRPTEVQRIDDWVHQAITAGAERLSGGQRLPNNCYAPTVLFNPPADANVSQLEIFGPVICVYAYDDIDQAIAQANALPFAFQASVFTQQLDTALHAYRHLDAAAVMINDHTAFRVDWMPFAGLKQSGHGVGGIPYTFEDMQVEKMLVVKSDKL